MTTTETLVKVFLFLIFPICSGIISLREGVLISKRVFEYSNKFLFLVFFLVGVAVYFLGLTFLFWIYPT